MDNATDGDPLHEGYSASVMPAPLSSEAELTRLVKTVYTDDEQGCVLYYAVLDADLIKARDVYLASAKAAGEPTTEPPAAAVPSTLVVWLIDAEGVVCMERAAAVGNDGRALDQLCTDLTTKLTLCFGELVTRGPPISNDVYTSRREELIARGVATTTDANGRLDVTNELALLSELLLKPVLAHIKPGAPVTIVPHTSLHGVPFGALPLADGKPLCERHALSFAPSLTILKQLHKRAQQAGAHMKSPMPPMAVIAGGALTSPTFELPAIPATALEAADVCEALTGSREITGDDGPLVLGAAVYNEFCPVTGV